MKKYVVAVIVASLLCLTMYGIILPYLYKQEIPNCTVLLKNNGYNDIKYVKCNSLIATLYFSCSDTTELIQVRFVRGGSYAEYPFNKFLLQNK